MRKILLVALLSFPAFAQYNAAAGTSAPTIAAERVVRDADGKERKEVVRVPVKKDGFGNAAGSQNDLAVDGAFEGQTVVVMHFYAGGGFDFARPNSSGSSRATPFS